MRPDLALLGLIKATPDNVRALALPVVKIAGPSGRPILPGRRAVLGFAVPPHGGKLW